MVTAAITLAPAAPTTPPPTAEQRAAVEAVFGDVAVLILTGGPGVGKTFTVRTIIEEADRRGWRTRLAAPTGKAAKRMAELCGRPAQTIHRLLRFTPAGWHHNAHNPIGADLVIIDETSMVDVHLGAALLDAVPHSARLLLVGDADQLPSVGPGNVLRDLIASGRIPVVRLTQVHRQSETSYIHLNAQALNRGDMPAEPEDADDWFFVEQDLADDVPERVRDILLKTLPANFPTRQDGRPWHPIQDCQILVPQHKGVAGVDALNTALQAALNPPWQGKAELLHYGTAYRVGDRVLHVRNNYDKGVMNGEGGLVVEVSKADRERAELWRLAAGAETVWVDYGADADPETGREVRRVIPYTRSDLDELVLAYAISIHKSQGSEFPFVIVVCHSTHTYMLSRQLIYTAVTRAREKVLLIGDRKGLRRAVRNDAPVQRFTRLAGLLRETAGAEELEATGSAGATEATETEAA